MIERIAKQLKNMIKRAVVTNTNDDSGDIPTTQVSYMGKVGDVEVLFPYGMSGVIPKGGLMVVFNNQGQEEYKMGIGNTPQDRVKGLLEGETTFGNPTIQTYIYFKADGSVVLNVDPSKDFIINAKDMVVNGNVMINGFVKARDDITDQVGTNGVAMSNFRQVYDTHTHNETGTVTNIPNQPV